MAFYEIQFPTDISYGAVGGPEWKTEVAQIHSGAEYRQQNWGHALHRYDVAHGLRDQTQLDTLRAFFNVTRGKTHGFRFKDWGNFNVSGSEGVFVQLTGTTFQMYKRDSVSGYNYDRKITKPVNGTIVVTGGTVNSINYTTGVVTMTSGTPASWTGQFDVPCRFDTDTMRVSIKDYGIYEWNQIPVTELRE